MRNYHQLDVLGRGSETQLQDPRPEKVKCDGVALLKEYITLLYYLLDIPSHFSLILLAADKAVLLVAIAVNTRQTLTVLKRANGLIYHAI